MDPPPPLPRPPSTSHYSFPAAAAQPSDRAPSIPPSSGAPRPSSSHSSSSRSFAGTSTAGATATPLDSTAESSNSSSTASLHSHSSTSTATHSHSHRHHPAPRPPLTSDLKEASSFNYSDSLLGPRPTTASSTTSAAGSTRSGGAGGGLYGPRGSSLGERELSPSRRVPYEEDGGERVARAMMQGLGLSTGDEEEEESRHVSPVLRGKATGESDGEGGGEEEQHRRREASWGVHPQQQQGYPSTSSSPFASSHPAPGYFNRADSTLGNHPSTSSLGSASTATTNSGGGVGGGGMMSPLSPLVEPFSPATSASGHSWGVREREPSNLDLRTHQPHQQQHSPHPSLVRQADFISSLPYPHSQSSFSTPSPSTIQQQQQQAHPYFSPRPALGSSSGSDPAFQHASAYSSSPYLQQGQQYGSDEGTGTGTSSSSHGGGGGGGGGAASTSRESFSPPTSAANPVAAAALFGLASRREREREIPTDRGGYVRAGYAEASARGAVLPPAAAGVGVGVGGGTPGTGTSSPALMQGMGMGGPEGAVGPGTEEISTIFVVGFPEDMLEREFQNIFIFATGFQAATLKIPASTVVARERERELAAAAALSSAVGGGGGSIAGAGIASASPYQADPYGGPLGPSGSGSGLDQLAAGGGFDDPYAAAASDPTAFASVLGPLVARESAGSPAGTRKQIIGFAKFNTRAQALDARDMLSGKKVDAEKGNVLKAEMAKKNLHTKRGLSNELATAGGGGPSFPLSALDQATLARLANAGNLSPAVLAELARQTAASQAAAAAAGTTPQPQAPMPLHPAPSQQQQQQGEAARHSAAFEAFHSVPTPSQPQPPQAQSQRTSSFSGSVYEEMGGGGGGGGGGGWSRAPRGYSRERTMSASPDYQQQQQQPLSSSSTTSASALVDSQPHSPASTSSSPRMRSSHAMGVGVQQATQSGGGGGGAGGAYGMSMMQQLDEGRVVAPASASSFSTPSTFDPLAYDEPTPLPPLNVGGGGGTSAYQFSSGGVSGPRFGSFGGGGGGPTSPSLGMGIEGVSNGGGGGGAAAIPRTQNPADMNAPKNTLYVGGLPAVLPSLTGPFSAAHLEDSLRNAFSRCPGFRRLSFRSKSNGPIVFVEFEDVTYATRALTEMYGNTLGGIVKGGIRLSYSKNPLGVRSGSISHNNGGGGSHSSSPSLGYGSSALDPIYGGAGGSPAYLHGLGPGPITSPQTYATRPSESVFGVGARSPPPFGGGGSAMGSQFSPSASLGHLQQQHQSQQYSSSSSSSFNNNNNNNNSNMHSSSSSNPNTGTFNGAFAPFS